jgi:hypothetical protein
MGSASVKVAMLIAQTSHRAALAWYNRILDEDFLQKTREENAT